MFINLPVKIELKIKKTKKTIAFHKIINLKKRIL